jgi:hypothetical protein
VWVFVLWWVVFVSVWCVCVVGCVWLCGGVGVLVGYGLYDVVWVLVGWVWGWWVVVFDVLWWVV